MSCKHVISCTIVTLILLFIVIGIPIIIYEAVVKPKDPKFTLEHASITGFNLSSDGHLTSFFDVIIKANNPNHKLKLKYTSVRISIFKNKQKLGEDALDNFTQRKKNVTMLRSEAVALNVKLKESSRFDFRFESGNGYLDFDVFLTASLNGNSLEKRAYDRYHLHLTKEFCSLPLKPYAPQANAYMSKNDFIEYIDDYVSDFNIRPRYYHSVESASFYEATEKWIVEAKDILVKATKVFVASFLVVATGDENDKSYIHDIPRLNDFKGDVMHSSEYKCAREFQDKDVLVVGYDNSGMEISYDLCNARANTSIVIRNSVRVLNS
uniref:Flavin-containing monooxygenase n=1 Tax=Chenopodium quinoa TaxID=63459 RepID=A0A803N6I1_CHEQI